MRHWYAIDPWFPEEHEKLLSIIDRLTYKPGWRFEVGFSNNDNPYFRYFELKLTYTAIDAVTLEPCVLNRVFTITPRNVKEFSEAQLVDHVFCGLVRSAELHEVDEWFKLSGKCVHNPHPEVVK